MVAVINETRLNQTLNHVAELEAEIASLKKANERLTSFKKLSERVSASLNIQQVLDTILDQITPVVSFDSATLMLVEQNQLKGVAARGFPSEHLVLNVYPRSSQNSAWRVVQNKRPLIIPDVYAISDWESREGLEKIRAWMGVPLIVKEQVIGVLTLDSNRPDIYSLDDAEFIFTLGFQVAIAVENASLFETVKAQHEQMSKLHELNQTIASILDLDTLLQTVIEQITFLLGSHWCSLWLFDEAHHYATATACFSRHDSQNNNFGTTIEIDQHPIMHQMRTHHQPMVIDRASLDADRTIFAQGPSGPSFLVVPLRYQEQNIGFIITDNTERREAFLSDRVALAMSAANQAALSIGAAKLFDELQKQADRLRLINEVARQITTILNVDDLLSILAQVLHDRLNYSVVTIFEVDSPQQEVILKAVTGESPNWLLPNVYRQKLSAGAIGEVVRSGQTLLVKDVRTRPKAFLIEGTDYLAGVVVPIVINNRLEAFISVQSEIVAAFNEHDVWTLQTLGQQAAIAVENAGLYRNITQRLDDLAVLNDAGQAFILTLDLDEILSIIMERTCTALAAEFGYVLLNDEAHIETTFLATVGREAQPLKGVSISLNETTIGRVVQTGKPLLVNDTADLPKFIAELDSHIAVSTQSIMAAPLKNKDEILGALIVTNKQGGEFNKNNLNLLTALAQLASGAIENARLFQKLQRYSQDLEAAVAARTNHLTVVNETSRAISSILVMDTLFTNVTRLISQLFSQARVSVALRTGNYLIFQKVYDGEFEVGEIPDNHRLHITDTHPLGNVLLSGEAQFIKRVCTADLYQLAEADQSDTTALMMPLAIGDKATGIILVQSKTSLSSGERGLETLQSLASQVAVAMENSRLLQKTREMTIVQERTRLARDMHDGVAQNLAYLLLQVDRCLTVAEVDSPKLVDELENMVSVIQQNIEELRRHIFDLRPVGLQGRSIIQVLEPMLREFGAQFQIQTSCQIIGDSITLAPAVESSLYRIFQEALSNIRRHADCTEVNVILEIRPDRSLTLTIADNGQGFEASEVVRNPLQRQGLGLVSMEERVRSLGGTFQIIGQPGQGTTVAVSLPDLTELETIHLN